MIVVVKMILITGRGKAGFTFLELLIVLLVVTLLTAASIPAFKTFAANMRLKAGARLTLNLLRQARADAISSHRNTYLVVASADGTWENLQYKAMKIMYEKSPNVYITLLNWEYLPKGLQINSSSSILGNTININYPNENGPLTSVGCAQFKPNGQASVSGTIKVELADDTSKYLEITYDNYSGRAKIK